MEIIFPYDLYRKFLLAAEVEMKTYVQKLVVGGFALLLFGVIAALNKSALSYISGGLGLFFVLLACFAGEEKSEE